MNIAFRVDASPEMGIGHFMRCLTLGVALRQRGAEVRFVTRRVPGHLQALVCRRGCEHASLDELFGEPEPVDRLAHSYWLGTSQRADAQATLRALSDRSWDWLVIDHYALDQRWESALRTAAARIFVVDDLADRIHDCDVLLDQNLFANPSDRYARRVGSGARLLLGPAYALLRPEFEEARRSRPRSTRPLEPVRRVNVCFGGTDLAGASLMTVEALKPRLEGRTIVVDVVLGDLSPHCDTMAALSRKYFGLSLHVAPTNIAELLAAADLGVGATGSMTWERACLGLPSVGVAVASNQQPVGEQAGLAGILLYAGEVDHVSAGDISASLERLMQDGHLRQALADRSLSVVDGLGAHRVADLMCFGPAGGTECSPM